MSDLAVGEKCHGDYEHGFFWCPRCKAKHPRDCITETAPLVPPAPKSIADQIPKWYEGGTLRQQLDEAFAQIRKLEGELARSVPAQGMVMVPRGWAEAAKCPECDGAGFNVRQPAAGEFEQVQCQWCFERHEYLSAAESSKSE